MEYVGENNKKKWAFAHFTFQPYHFHLGSASRKPGCFLLTANNYISLKKTRFGDANPLKTRSIKEEFNIFKGDSSRPWLVQRIYPNLTNIITDLKFFIGF
jgi:hypothetical protein